FIVTSTSCLGNPNAHSEATGTGVACGSRPSRACGHGPAFLASINFRQGEPDSVRPGFGVVFMGRGQKIVPCLWFDDRGEEAAGFYTTIFPTSRIVGMTRYSDAGREGPREGARVGDDRGVRARRASLHRPERRAGVPVQRGDLAAGLLRHAGGD